MNKVFLIGNLTSDPKLTTIPSGASVCRFAIAVNRAFTGANGERQTDYFNITAWKQLGERVAQYCKKGNKVCVTGSIQIRNYEDNQGVQRTVVDIIAQDVEFLTPKSGEDGANNEGGTTSHGRNDGGGTGGKRAQLQPLNDDDDDIPF